MFDLILSKTGSAATSSNSKAKGGKRSLETLPSDDRTRGKASTSQADPESVRPNQETDPPPSELSGTALLQPCIGNGGADTDAIDSGLEYIPCQGPDGVTSGYLTLLSQLLSFPWLRIPRPLSPSSIFDTTQPPFTRPVPRTPSESLHGNPSALRFSPNGPSIYFEEASLIWLARTLQLPQKRFIAHGGEETIRAAMPSIRLMLAQRADLHESPLLTQTVKICTRLLVRYAGTEAVTYASVCMKTRCILTPTLKFF